MKRAIVGAAAAASIGIVAIAYGTRRRDVTDNRARVSRTVTVRGDATDLYAMWRMPAALEQFLHPPAAVESLGADLQRWTFRNGERTMAVDLEVVEDSPGRRLEWRGDAGGYKLLASVTFMPAPAQRGTEVRFTLSLTGPAAHVLSAVARPFGVSLPQVAMESLRRFKALAEAGEIPKAVRS